MIKMLGRRPAVIFAGAVFGLSITLANMLFR
jgi:hypothetical protein